MGQAIGQTFRAITPYIRRITVWRIAVQDTNVFGIHLFILETDSLGAPSANRVLLNGPTVFAPYGDGVHHIRFDFLFDPPYALPAMGTYCFALQASPCIGWWDLIDDHNDDYPQGFLWLFGRSDCYLRAFPQKYPASDLIFEIEFCDMATPTRKTSWGHLKTIYR